MEPNSSARRRRSGRSRAAPTQAAHKRMFTVRASDKGVESRLPRPFSMPACLLHSARAMLSVVTHRAHSAVAGRIGNQGAMHAAHRANSCQASAPVWYIWPNTAQNTPMNRPAAVRAASAAWGARRRSARNALTLRTRPVSTSRRRTKGGMRCRLAAKK